MKICTFFGHRDAPDHIKEKVRQAIISLIKEESVDCFYVGHNGNFDRMVAALLAELEKKYHFQYAIIIEKVGQEVGIEWQKTMLPQEIETVPPRFAVWHRNCWMIEQADYVITYQVHTFGGTGQFVALAEKKNKKIIYVQA